MVTKFNAHPSLLETYEEERKPVAIRVIETSGELVRATKYSPEGTHAQDYVKIVQKHAGNVTGMGVRYGDQGLRGTRLFDFTVFEENQETRIYSLLGYAQYTLIVFTDREIKIDPPEWIKVIQVHSRRQSSGCWSNSHPYSEQAVLVRPDSYIESCSSVEKIETLLRHPESFTR